MGFLIFGVAIAWVLAAWLRDGPAQAHMNWWNSLRPDEQKYWAKQFRNNR